jgi:hypothetical protein
MNGNFFINFILTNENIKKNTLFYFFNVIKGEDTFLFFINIKINLIIRHQRLLI